MRRLLLPFPRLSLRAQATAVVVALIVPAIGIAVVFRDSPLGLALDSALFVGLAVAVARRAAGRVTASIAALSDAAAALDPGERRPVGAPGLWAIDEVTTAMRRAAATLAIRAEERDLAEARLRRSEQHLAQAQKVADIGSFERSFSPDAIYWSDHIYKIYGVDKASFEVTVESILALIHPDDRATYASWRQLSAEESAICEHRIIRANGEQRVLRSERESIRDAAGTLIGLVGTTRDITEARAAEERQRELERQLRHSQRLEALGTLAGGIAHDLNNTLMPVVALPSRLIQRLADHPALQSQLRLIEQAGIHARELVKQILSFSRKDGLARERLVLPAFIEELLPLLRSSSPSTVRLEFEKPAPPLAVMADSGQLRQVLVNLVANAVHAIGGAQGTITLAVERARLAHAEAARIGVRDTGCGMSQQTLDRIFEPFFTTKLPGEGTGLGLAVVHGIVTNHGGTIRAASRPGEGTSFDITLPLAEAEDFVRRRELTPHPG